ncbi:MAG: BrnT family toxin [Coxiellaceae bacterium]|nr:BrnT family toxin [Coxiellaceae bacterium]
MDILNELQGFQWDNGNIQKNWLKHQVSQTECEEVFFNDPLLLFEDQKHSERESRNYVLGKTNRERKLFIVFTVRSKCIRVISARDMSKRERHIYDKI